MQKFESFFPSLPPQDARSNIDGFCTRNGGENNKSMTRLESVISFRVSAIVVAVC